MKIVLTSLIGLILALSAYAQDEPTTEKPLRGEAEAGAIMVTGTSDSNSYAVKGKLAYEWEKNVITASGHYIKVEANSVESARNWDAALRYDRLLSDYFSAYVGQKVESDIFAGYLQRDSTDLGVKLFQIKTDTLQWFYEDREEHTSELQSH